jgi:hypothetical protein
MKTTIYLLAASLLSGTIGCTSEKPSDMQQRQQQMLDDPYGYEPDKKKYDISGGGLGEFDNDAFRKDMDSVFNP